MKKAFITGITGQDGSYLAELLLDKCYEIHGLIRRSSSFNTERIDHLYKDFHDPKARIYLHYGDLSISGQLTDMLYDISPDEIYHLGAQSHVRVSFDMFTRPLPARCLALRRRLRTNQRPFNLGVPMPPPRSMPITWCKITGTPTSSLPATASFSTTNRPGGVKHS